MAVISRGETSCYVFVTTEPRVNKLKCYYTRYMHMEQDKLFRRRGYSETASPPDDLPGILSQKT